MTRVRPVTVSDPDCIDSAITMLQSTAVDIIRETSDYGKISHIVRTADRAINALTAFETMTKRYKGHN